MATILLRCPSTGKYLSTGIEAEPETFWALPDLAAPVRCLHCRSVHDFAKRQALLVDPNRWSEHPKVEDCLIKATECAESAASARPRNRTFYLRLEQQWLKLAKEFERLARADGRPAVEPPSLH